MKIIVNLFLSNMETDFPKEANFRKKLLQLQINWAKLKDKYQLKHAKPDVGICFATDYTDVLFGSEIVVLLGVRTSGRLKQQPHYKRIFTLEHWVRNRDNVTICLQRCV